MSNQLLPCPFCGGPAKHHEGFPGNRTTWCSNQPVNCSNRSMYSVEEWNRRATQPAAGEPAAWQWRSRIKGGAWDAWENGRYDFEPAPFMDVEHRALYAAPPAAAHGDEAVRKDAEAAYVEMTCQPVLIDGAHHYYLSSERMQAFDRLFSIDVSNAAMRAQGDGEVQ